MKVLSPKDMGYNLQPLKIKVVGSHGGDSTRIFGITLLSIIGMYDVPFGMIGTRKGNDNRPIPFACWVI